MYHVNRLGKKGSASLLVVLALTLFGCSEKWEPKPLTVTQLIAGEEKKVWQLSSLEIIDEGEVEGPYTPRDLYETCARDNEYIFYNNEEKKYEFTSGAVKCSPNEPAVLLEHEWSYTTVNSTFEFALPIALFGDIYILPFTVKKLTDVEMVLEVYFSKVYVDETDASFRVVLRSDNS